MRDDGHEAIRKTMDAARPLLEFKLEQTVAKLPLDTPEARARAVREVAEVLGWHPDPIARHEYAFLAARRIGVDPEAIHRALQERASRVPGSRGEEDGGQGRRLPGHVKVEREALQLLLTRSEDVGPLIDDLDEGYFTSPARREVFRTGRDSALAAGVAPRSKSVEAMSDDGRALLTELSVGAGETGEDLAERAAEVFVRLRVFSLEREIRTRRESLHDVNPVDDPERHDALFTELVGLEAKRRDLLRRLQGVA